MAQAHISQSGRAVLTARRAVRRIVLPLAAAIALLAPILAACGSESIPTASPSEIIQTAHPSEPIRTARQSAALVNADPIPLPPDLEDSVAALAAGFGFRLDEIQTGAPPPPISAEGATEIAGQAHLEHLRLNEKPLENVDVPDALLRRLWVKPQEGIQKTVWVVVFRGDCPSQVDGPSCNHHSSYFVDDQTGEVVGGMSA